MRRTQECVISEKATCCGQNGLSRHTILRISCLPHPCAGDDTDGEEDEDDESEYEEAPLHNSSSARDALPDMDQHDGNDSDDSEGAPGCLTRLSAATPLQILQSQTGLVNDFAL